MPNTNAPYIIAIDGTAGSGKGTLSKRLAKHFNYVHLDTGKLYRATAYKVLQNGGDVNNIQDALSAVKSLQAEDFTNPKLTSNAIGNSASIVSKIPQVRQALEDYQRTYPNGHKGAVIDGRDIGTVIFPSAHIKFFVDADVKIRAERRTAELQNSGAIYEEILSDLKARDEADKNRAISPLVPADDAHHIDTSHIDIDTMLKNALDKF